MNPEFDKVDLYGQILEVKDKKAREELLSLADLLRYILDKVRNNETKIEDINVLIESIQTTVSDLESRVSQDDIEIADVKASLDVINATVALMADSISGLETNVAKNRDDISAQGATIVSILTTIDEIGGRLNSIDSSINTINGNINTINGNINALVNNVANNAQAIQTLNNGLSDAKLSIQENADDITVIEEDIADISNQLATIQSTLDANNKVVSKTGTTYGLTYKLYKLGRNVSFYIGGTLSETLSTARGYTEIISATDFADFQPQINTISAIAHSVALEGQLNIGDNVRLGYFKIPRPLIYDETNELINYNARRTLAYDLEQGVGLYYRDSWVSEY